jgi:hypothetical protein
VGRAATIGHRARGRWRHAAWLAIAVSGIAAAVQPLPEVWHRQFRVAGDGTPYLELVPMADGDVAIVDGDDSVAFFSGATLPAGRVLSTAARVTTNPYVTTIPNGLTVRRIGPPGCMQRPGVTVAVEDAQRRKLAEYALLWVPETPRQRTAADCDLVEMPPLKQRVVILDPQLLGLSDGTFLAADAGLGVVFRFDQRFGSRTPLLNDRLLRMPAAEMRALVMRHERPPHDGGFRWAAFQSELERWVQAHRGPPSARVHSP